MKLISIFLIKRIKQLFHVKLAEAPSFGKPIFYYEKYSKPAFAYKKFADEFLKKQ